MTITIDLKEYKVYVEMKIRLEMAVKYIDGNRYPDVQEVRQMLTGVYPEREGE